MLSTNQFARIFKFYYHKNYLRSKVPFLNIVKFSWKLEFDIVTFFRFTQPYPKCSEKTGNTDLEGRLGPSMWFFGFKQYTTFENLWKPHGYEKSSSSVVIKNALDQSDCITL